MSGFAFTGVLRETQDSIEEFRVTTGDANADAGRSSGAQISMVTKSGTNKFHGAAYEYNRPTFTVANDWFNKQAQIKQWLAECPRQAHPQHLRRRSRRADSKDKLFFFGNYEGTRQAENTQVNRTTVRLQPIRRASSSIPMTRDTRSAHFGSQVATLDAGCQICNTAIIRIRRVPIQTLWPTSIPCRPPTEQPWAMVAKRRLLLVFAPQTRQL